MLKFAILGGAALSLAACATMPRVMTDHDPATDFTRIRTYSWVYSQPPSGMNPLLFERVKASIDRSLAARSFTLASPGDVAVAFTLGARDRVETRDFGTYSSFYPGWGRPMGPWGWTRRYSNTEIRSFTEGTLAIDMFDTATKRPVWHGSAAQRLSRDSVDQQQIDAAVDAVLARFPPSQ